MRLRFFGEKSVGELILSEENESKDLGFNFPRGSVFNPNNAIRIICPGGRLQNFQGKIWPVPVRVKKSR